MTAIVSRDLFRRQEDSTTSDSPGTDIFETHWQIPALALALLVVVAVVFLAPTLY